LQKSSLEDWLAWQSTLSPREIDLGLERVHKAWGYLGSPIPAAINILVSGTNGKGSCVAYLQSMLLAAGYSVGSYTSPHLFRYNERIRVNGIEAADEVLCNAFERVENTRQSIPLTYFEFGTLAAFHILAEQGLDVAILEIGLGGRLDAVNIIDADVALVTNIELDHMDWLGHDREAIGYEKAGIFRSGRPAVFGDTSPPTTLISCAQKLGVDLQCFDEDFRIEQHNGYWDWIGRTTRRTGLPLPSMQGGHQLQNAASCLAVLESLEGRLDVAQSAVCEGISSTVVEGRIQILNSDPIWVFDVAHNGAATVKLADSLNDIQVRGRCYLVMGLLANKEVEAIVRPLAKLVDQYHFVGLTGPRGQSSGDLALKAGRYLSPDMPVKCHKSVQDALDYLEPIMESGDVLVVSGSFMTVSAGLSWYRDRHPGVV